MAKINPNPAFILHGGDTYPYHGTESSDYIKAVYNGTHILKKYFPNSPIIYALGNHDCFPYFQIGPDDPWLARLADEALFDILTPQQAVTFKKGGYYVAFAGGFKIIVVNTIFYYSENKKTKDIITDVASQRKFIETEIEQAK